jgi:GTP-binding protein
VTKRVRTSQRSARPDSAPIIAIVGRPNVGKSALFNRLIGRRKALVEELAGTTRDRLYGDVTWRGGRLRIVDTGGLETAAEEGYPELIRRQVEQAVEEASALLFVVDAKDGVITADEEVAAILRRSKVPIFLLANKVDNEARIEGLAEFYELGLGEPMPVSAQHGTGIADVLDRLVATLPTAVEEEAIETPRLAIVGRPNVGKSMLLNAILQEERVIVSPVPGTTRDAIDTPFEFEGREIVLIDTAGLRRPGKIGRGVEHHAGLRVKHTVDRADVTLVLLDASEGLTAQDTHIIGLALKSKTGVMVVANKWDLMGGIAPAEFEEQVRRRLHFAPWAAFCIVSAMEAMGITPLLRQALRIYDARRQRIETAPLNAVVQRAVAERPPSTVRNQQPKFLYATQAEIAPPTFVFFVSDASLVHFSYRRYLENVLRERFGFQGVALRLVFRSRRER